MDRELVQEMWGAHMCGGHTCGGVGDCGGSVCTLAAYLKPLDLPTAGERRRGRGTQYLMLLI